MIIDNDGARGHQYPKNSNKQIALEVLDGIFKSALGIDLIEEIKPGSIPYFVVR